jgi:hypothetical protein
MSLPDTETPDHLRRLTGDAPWYGFLTLENLDLVAGRLRRLLTDRRFTWVACDAAMRNYRPEVRTSQELAEAGVKVSWDDDETRRAGFITVSYTEYLAIIDTSISGHDEIKALGYDKCRKHGAYLSFTHDQVRIEQVTDFGLIYWAAAVELPD